MTDVVHSLPVEPESVDLAHDLLDDLWEGDQSVTDLDRIRFTTAFVEIVGNVVEHAYDLDDSGERLLEIQLRLDPTSVEAQIEDNGMPAAIDLGSATMPDADAESGRGLPLAIAAVDSLTYERHEGRNRWTVVCRRGEG